MIKEELVPATNKHLHVVHVNHILKLKVYLTIIPKLTEISLI